MKTRARRGTRAALSWLFDDEAPAATPMGVDIRTRSATMYSLVLLGCLGLAACSDSDAGAQGEDRDAGDPFGPRVPDQGAPPEVEAAAQEWPMANRNYDNTRATFDSQIDASNIDQLTERWQVEIVGEGYVLGGAATAPALVVDDTVYYQDMNHNLLAIDLESGEVLWDKHIDRPSAGPNGIAIGWGKIFAEVSSDEFAALDLKDGTKIWSAQFSVRPNGGIDISPLAYDGRVYVSTVPVNLTTQYAGDATGILYALDQHNGEVLWEFDTVDSSDIWGNRWVNSGGGAWFPPSIDLETGTTYWGTGNPGPWPGTPEFPSGASRPGENLYTDSVVAIDSHGELVWYHQEREHDLFDLDFHNSPVRARVDIDGEATDVIIGSGKTGTVVALDASDGKLLWRAEVGVHMNDDLDEVPEDMSVEVYPGPLGGVETNLAYADGVVYVPVVNLSASYEGATFVQSDNFGEGTGELVALDASDGSEKWQVDLPAESYGYATVVNDLVLTSDYSGNVYAFAREDGTEVWTYEAPAGINAPLTAVGDTLIIPAGTGVGIPVLVALSL